MNIEAKILIPNKEWILRNDTFKIGTIFKVNKGYHFFKKGNRIFLKNKEEVKKLLGINLIENSFNNSLHKNLCIIYDYPCNTKPYNSLFDLKNKMALFTKSNKSKSKYCAGYFLIKFKKGWVKSFCPKLITIERYKYIGPFKTEIELKDKLSKLNKSEKT